MKIQVHEIPEEGLALDLDGTDEALGPVLAEVNEGKPASDFHCHLNLTRDESVITVDGDLSGRLTLACARCLEPVDVPLDEHFRFFMRGPLERGEVAAEELELSGEALDYAFLEGDTIDIPSLVQEQVLLGVPSQPLCRPDCKGICQRCGAELNREPCRCADKDVDPRFAVLKGLKLS